MTRRASQLTQILVIQLLILRKMRPFRVDPPTIRRHLSFFVKREKLSLLFVRCTQVCGLGSGEFLTFLVTRDLEFSVGQQSLSWAAFSERIIFCCFCLTTTYYRDTRIVMNLHKKSGKE